MRPSEWVDGSRLWNRLMDLARFGAREDGGVDRQTLTDAEIAARAQVVAWGRALGLSPYTDAAANLFLRFEGRDPTLPRTECAESSPPTPAAIALQPT